MADARIVDIEQDLRTFFSDPEPGGLDIIAVGAIFLQKFPVGEEGTALMIGRVDTVALEHDSPIDVSRVEIWSQDSDPGDSFDLIKKVVDRFDAIFPQTLGENFLFSAELDVGPVRRDLDGLELARHFTAWNVRVRVQESA